MKNSKVRQQGKIAQLRARGAVGGVMAKIAQLAQKAPQGNSPSNKKGKK